MNRRVVVWFSCGAASAVAGKLAIEKYGDDVVFACCVIPNEHPDNERFIQDCEKWYGKPIIRLKSDKYKDAWEIWEKTKLFKIKDFAHCTLELKKKVRQKFQKISDIQVFGFTSDEKHRVERFMKANPEVDLYVPLIENNKTKLNCFFILRNAGIKLPEMYKLGYNNNNCIGCVKGGAGYWNKIRKDFPEVFDRMAKLERSINRNIVKYKNKYVFLDELPPDYGRYESELEYQCGFFCEDKGESK